MLTTAVGVVDRAANETTFLVVKRDASMTTTAKDGENGGLRLPAAAKESLADGIADALEKLTALSQQINECEVDEGAECPPELASQVDEIADDLDELADEFSPKATPKEMAEKAAHRAAYMKAKKPFPGAAPPFGKGGEVSKDSPPGAPPEQTKDRPGEGGGSWTATAQNGPGDTKNPDVVMKSGRKMAQERLAALQKGHDMHAAALGTMDAAHKMYKSAHDMVGGVLKDVGGTHTPPKPYGGGSAVPESPKPAPAEPSVTPQEGAPDVTGMAKSAAAAAVRDELSAPLATVTAALAEMKNVQKAVTEAASLLEARAKTGLPRANPNEGGPPAAPATPRTAWPSDMSAAVKQKKAATPPK